MKFTVEKIISAFLAVILILFLIYYVGRSCSISESENIEIKKYDEIEPVQAENYLDQLKIDNIETDLDKCEISGTVKNVLNKDIKYIEVELNWYDSDRNIITRDICNCTDLRKNQEWPIIFFFAGIEYDEYECYCEMDICEVEVYE